MNSFCILTDVVNGEGGKVMVRDESVLDDPVLTSLLGTHAPLSRWIGAAGTYLPEVATFASVGSEPAAEDWDDLASLLGSGQLADLFSGTATPPAHWEPVFELAGRQLVGPESPIEHPGNDTPFKIRELGADDVAAMLDLVARTRPGPFWSRTRELGTYLGIHLDGALVAMAGERLRPPGWTEISAVCTAPEQRGRGYAAALIQELVGRITARGDQPFLHAAESNTGAIALYERLGFRTRQRVVFRGFRVP